MKGKDRKGMLSQITSDFLRDHEAAVAFNPRERIPLYCS
jgi:hypothetical protein